MKISLSILAIGLVSTVTEAFGPIGSVSSSKSPQGGPLSSETPTADEPQEPAAPEPLFPTVMPMETLQGGKTVRTCELLYMFCVFGYP